MYKSSVYKTLALITQIGISIMVPIFLMLIISILIKNNFDVDLILVFVIIGVVVGIRNTILLINNFLNEEKMCKDIKESELVKKHKDYINKNK